MVIPSVNSRAKERDIENTTALIEQMAQQVENQTKKRSEQDKVISDLLEQNKLLVEKLLDK